MTKPGVSYEDLCKAASEAQNLREKKRRGVDVRVERRALEARIFEVS